MAVSRFSGRWMTPPEQQNFLRDLRKPQYSELRSIIQDSQSSYGNLEGLEYWLPPMHAVGLAGSAAIGASASLMGGFYWRGGAMDRFGLFGAGSIGMHTNLAAGIMLNYMEVFPWKNFFGHSQTIGVAAGEIGCGEFFLIYPFDLHPPVYDDEIQLQTSRKLFRPVNDARFALRTDLIGFGVGGGVGASALPAEVFVEDGYTAAVWDGKTGLADSEDEMKNFRRAVVRPLKPLIAQGRDLFLRLLQEVVEQSGLQEPAGLGRAGQRIRQVGKDLRHAAKDMGRAAKRAAPLKPPLPGPQRRR